MRKVKYEFPYVLMILPAIAVFLVFFIAPLLYTAKYSFYNWTNFSPDIVYSGIPLQDTSVGTGIRNSLKYAICTVLIQNLISLPVSVMLNTKLKGRNLF